MVYENRMRIHLILLVTFALMASSCAATSNSTTNSCKLASFSQTPTSGSEVGVGYTQLGGLSVAQPFIVTQAGKAINASAQLFRNGTFTRNAQTLVATLEGDDSGNPDSSPLATSTSIDPANISSTNATIYTFTFGTSVALTASTRYWLRIKASYAANSTNYITWYAYDGNTGGYTSGNTVLNAVYETGTLNTFSNSLLGAYRFLIFSVGCAST